MAVFQIKVIKTTKMNIPKVQKELALELERQGKITQKEYEKTTRTWSGAKPKFESITDIHGTNASVLTGPTGSDLAVSKFNWLDKGTKAHTIKARRAPRLRFRVGGFKAKTKPGVIGSSRGAAARGPIVYRKQVRHPGTQARKFTETIEKRRKKPFINAMIKASNKGAREIYK